MKHEQTARIIQKESLLHTILKCDKSQYSIGIFSDRHYFIKLHLSNTVFFTGITIITTLLIIQNALDINYRLMNKGWRRRLWPLIPIVLVRPICDRAFSHVSVTSVAGGGGVTKGGSKFLPINFNTSFQFVFHKKIRFGMCHLTMFNSYFMIFSTKTRLNHKTKYIFGISAKQIHQTHRVS